MCALVSLCELRLLPSVQSGDLVTLNVWVGTCTVVCFRVGPGIDRTGSLSSYGWSICIALILWLFTDCLGMTRHFNVHKIFHGFYGYIFDFFLLYFTSDLLTSSLERLKKKRRVSVLYFASNWRLTLSLVRNSSILFYLVWDILSSSKCYRKDTRPLILTSWS